MNTSLVSVLLYTASFVRAQDKAGPLNDPVSSTGFPLEHNLHGTTRGLHKFPFNNNAYDGGFTNGNSFADGSLREGPLHSAGAPGEAIGAISYRGYSVNSVKPSFTSGSASGGSWTDGSSTSRGMSEDFLDRNPSAVRSLAHGPGSFPFGAFSRADPRLSGHSGVSSWLGSPARSSSGNVRLVSTSTPLLTITSAGGELPSSSRGGWADSISRASSIGNSGAIGSGISRLVNRIVGDTARGGGSASTRFLNVLRGHSSSDTSMSRNSLSSGLLAAVSGGPGLNDKGQLSGSAVRSHSGGIPYTGALGGLFRRVGAFRAPGHIPYNGVPGHGPNAGVRSYPWRSRAGAAPSFFRGLTGFPDEQAQSFNPIVHSSRYFGSTSGSYPGLSDYNTANAAGSSGSDGFGNRGSYGWSSGPRSISFGYGGSASFSEIADAVKKFMSKLGKSW
uniref:Glycine rich superfamily member n=1 Tax=Rhipicephalus zambeziensis TaxID=60191 RepID=A0A224YEX2_9ACAR